MKWTEINEKNQPKFSKLYAIGRAKKNWFKPSYIYFGVLYKIEIINDIKRYIFSCDYPEDHYVSDATHFIEVQDLPKVPKNK